MKLINITPLIFICFLLMNDGILVAEVYAQTSCTKDDLGRVYCAPPGGTAVNAMTGVVCAPGRCVTDDLGYLMCSSKTFGGAITSDLGEPICVGGCIRPTKDFCEIKNLK